MSERQYMIEKVIPGGILPTDHAHRVTVDGTCSRCRREIDDDEVPIMLWTDDDTLWMYCNGCDALTRPAVPRLH